MPRIYLENRDPLDFCFYDFPDEQTAHYMYGRDIEYDAEHPEYVDSFDGEYACEVCGCSLTPED